MLLSWEEINSNAVAFAKHWEHARSEKSDAQRFMNAFLAVFGVEDSGAVGTFENPALRETGRGFMDYFWPKKIAVEMKSKGADLKKAHEQLKDYVLHLPAEEMPELLMVSDFETIILYFRTTNRRKQFKTKDLRKNIRYFSLLAGYESKREIEEQDDVNIRAAEKMANLHDALKNVGYEGHELEIYLVRLLFCLFAEDTGIFPPDSFLDYVRNSKEDGSNLSQRIVSLFEVLNMPGEARMKRTLLSADLKQFQYINGGLFQDRLSSPDYDAKMRQTLMDCCKFDWSKISPAIFGAMFQGVMNEERRREVGAHYTSEDNILKLLNPLFLDDLRAKFDRIKTDTKLLDKFHNEIAGLKFFDPACGCGNFLIVAYRKLRELELEILKMKLGRIRQKRLDISSLLKVSIEQFYGIEIEDFPCEVARVGMWLADHQMNLLVAEEFGQYFARLPLIKSATIIHGNALRIDWESLVPKDELSYIMGNPPYVGFTYMNTAQKEDMMTIFPKTKNLDYVSAWYMKTADYVQNTRVECAFVSTNSICQGETLAALWKKVLNKNISVNFAYRPFRWSNEAKGKAAVHCVIIGFAVFPKKEKVLFDGERKTVASHINPYLIDAPDIMVESRSTPLCDVPHMVYGNKPADGGHLIIEAEDYDTFVVAEPTAIKYIKCLMGADEYLNNKKRYCLWFVGVSPLELRKMPKVMERIDQCRQSRQSSIAVAIRKFAETPALFAQVTQPAGVDYIVVPRTSSERRKYIPIGFLTSETIVSDAVQIIPGATLYHFGILTSSIHMSWMRAVCGRLEMRYRYSKDIVYNNFPWAKVTAKQKVEIETLAQSVLDARTKFPESSLADLYDPLTMPKELLKAHERLDRAVMKLYGFGKDFAESQIVAALMKRYQTLREKK
ncbi:MAG: class I SAM-dependent DNA methyltransferase [Thermoguttaceae bacterium]